MKRGTYRSIAVLILALGLLTSGCFQIRTFRQSPAALNDGERGVTYLKLYQVSQDEGNSDAYTFILIGYENTDLKLKKVSDFDLDGNYGGPFSRVRDNALRDLLITGTNCAASGVSASSITGMKWWAYRTTAKMDSTAAGYEEALRINVKFLRLFADDGDRGDFVIFSGTWADLTDDGTPDAGETVCGGMIFSSFSGA